MSRAEVSQNFFCTPTTHAARTRTHARGPSVRRPAPRVDYGTMKYYHATSAAQAILADGFRDWSGSYGLRDVEGTPLILTGVFIMSDSTSHGRASHAPYPSSYKITALPPLS